MMIRTASHLLGGEACGSFCFTELREISVLIDSAAIEQTWQDAVALQSFLVGLASSKMSLELHDQVVFTCQLFAFPRGDLCLSYFMWREEQAALTALDRYCSRVLLQGERTPAMVSTLMQGLERSEKEEILRQNQIEFNALPAWQRNGVGVYIDRSDQHLIVESHLPKGDALGTLLRQFL